MMNKAITIISCVALIYCWSGNVSAKLENKAALKGSLLQLKYTDYNVIVDCNLRSPVMMFMNLPQLTAGQRNHRLSSPTPALAYERGLPRSCNPQKLKSIPSMMILAGFDYYSLLSKKAIPVERHGDILSAASVLPLADSTAVVYYNLFGRALCRASKLPVRLVSGPVYGKTRNPDPLFDETRQIRPIAIYLVAYSPSAKDVMAVVIPNSTAANRDPLRYLQSVSTIQRLVSVDIPIPTASKDYTPNLWRACSEEVTS